jgi:hypothetical protein
MVPFRLVQWKISTHRRKNFYTQLEHERGVEPLTILPLDLEHAEIDGALLVVHAESHKERNY